jgi:hypothetical protein
MISLQSLQACHARGHKLVMPISMVTMKRTWLGGGGRHYF